MKVQSHRIQNKIIFREKISSSKETWNISISENISLIMKIIENF